MRIVRALVALAMVAVVAWIAWADWIEPALDDEPTARPTTTRPTQPVRPTATAEATRPPVVPATGTVTTTLRRAAARLTVVPEDRQRYVRSRFGRGWTDADEDCRDTRQEVLARESLVPVGDACRILRGRWLSYYDDQTWTRSLEVQIDHLVPLAEAWDSGAYQWDGATRIRYANDLGDRRGLVPTTTALNYAKVADDPQRFVPRVNRCRYIGAWIAVKLRWGLTVDRRELAAIRAVAAACPDERISVRRARIGLLAFAAGTGTRDPDVRIESIAYRGSAERVVLRNRGTDRAVLAGWVLEDAARYGQLRLPRTVLPAGATLTIVSTTGSTRTRADGSIVHHAGWGDVWNDTGDTATLVDGSRRVTDTCRYRGDPSGKARC